MLEHNESRKLLDNSLRRSSSQDLSAISEQSRNHSKKHRNHSKPQSGSSSNWSLNDENFQNNNDYSEPDLEMYADSPGSGDDGSDSEQTYSMANSTDSLNNKKPSRRRQKSSNQFINIAFRISDWMDGPSKPWSPSATPFFPKLQKFPKRLKKQSPAFFYNLFWVIFLGLWTMLFFFLSLNTILAVPKVDGSSVSILNCGTTFQAWLGKNELCGLNGTKCRAMDPEMKDLVFKCPAGCNEDGRTWSYSPVGDLETIYQPYVIGGGSSSDKESDTWNSYRADSYVCPSALHHGYMSNREGKIGRIVFNGPKSKFLGSKGNAGISSLDFNGWFPQSFSFDDDFPTHHKLSGGNDIRWTIVWINIVLSAIFGYFMVSGLVFYWIMMILGFWTVSLASNPPWINADFSSEQAISELISTSFRHFLPFMLGAYVIWRCSGRGVLLNLDAHLSKSILWIGGFWVAVLENYTFSKLPINRLIISDIKQQKGGMLTVIVIVVVILAIAVKQAVIIWRMGSLKKYLAIYLLMILGLVLLACIPNQTLRIHHYILGLLLLPGVGFETTSGLLYQGLLVGFYVSGIARWDFDSIIQTALQLNRGDALDYGGLPEFKDVLINFAGNSTDLTVKWYDILHSASSQGDYIKSLWNGYSLIVNDIEVYRGNETEISLSSWINHAAQTTSLDSLKNVYLRLAFANLVPSIDTTGDYTKAGVIDLVNATWVAPAAGPS